LFQVFYRVLLRPAQGLSATAGFNAIYDDAIFGNKDLLFLVIEIKLPPL